MRAAVGAVAAILVGCGAPTSSLPSHVPPRVAGATALGPVGADEPVTFVVAMKLRDRARLDALLAAGATLTPAAFADAFAPSATEYADVVAALRARGLAVTESPTRTTLTAAGRAADVERALGTTLIRYVDRNGAFRAPGELVLAAGMEAFVDGVAGLDDAARWWSQRVPGPPAPAPQGASGSVEPADLATMYDLGGAGLGDGETIAILGTGLPPANDDLDGYVAKFALPIDRARQYSQLFLGGPNRDPDGLVQNEYYENVLDAEMALAVAPHADVVHVLTATNSPGLFSDGIVYIVNQLARAHQVSVSYGTCERVAAGEMLVMNNLFAQARAEGQQWFFASGDNGTDGCRDGKGNKVLSVNWPASSPYVVAVGGTALDGASEVAWSGGGGGQSEIIDKPAFQVGATPADGVRDEPDVAALAGAPGVAIYAQGMLFAGVEGTSCATPMWAAVWALLDAGKGNHAGFSDGAERLYALGRAGSAGLRDVTTGGIGDGTTPGYPATAGWDFATGWGTPDVGALVTAW